MHPEQYEDRKRYINAIKSSFSTSGQPLNANEQGGDNNRSEKVPHSFLGVRFFLALCLFLAFFAIKHTDTSWKGWDARKSPGSFSLPWMYQAFLTGSKHFHNFEILYFLYCFCF